MRRREARILFIIIYYCKNNIITRNSITPHRSAVIQVDLKKRFSIFGGVFEYINKMENKKKGGGTPRDCESLRIFVPDKARRQRVTVHGKYEQGNQFEMYFEKELTSLKERLP